MPDSSSSLARLKRRLQQLERPRAKVAGVFFTSGCVAPLPIHVALGSRYGVVIVT